MSQARHNLSRFVETGPVPIKQAVLPADDCFELRNGLSRRLCFFALVNGDRVSYLDHLSRFAETGPISIKQVVLLADDCLKLRNGLNRLVLESVIGLFQRPMRLLEFFMVDL